MRRLPLLVCVVACAAWFAACGTQPPPASSAPRGTERIPAWISLERTHGGRSIYVVTLFEDGRAILETVTNDRRRTLSKTVAASDARRVFAILETIDFWQREPRYDVEYGRRGNDRVVVQTAPPDAPWDIIRAQRQSQMKRIDGLQFAPSELLALKTLIEEIVNLRTWLAEAASM